MSFLRSDPIVITIQAFLQNNEVVPLSMTHQSLYVSVETQVAIAGIILAGVYILIIFEVNGLWCSRFSMDDKLVCVPSVLPSLEWVTLTVQYHSRGSSNFAYTQIYCTVCMTDCMLMCTKMSQWVKMNSHSPFPRVYSFCLIGLLLSACTDSDWQMSLSVFSFVSEDDFIQTFARHTVDTFYYSKTLDQDNLIMLYCQCIGF